MMDSESSSRAQGKEVRFHLLEDEHLRLRHLAADEGTTPGRLVKGLVRQALARLATEPQTPGPESQEVR